MQHLRRIARINVRVTPCLAPCLPLVPQDQRIDYCEFVAVMHRHNVPQSKSNSLGKDKQQLRIVTQHVATKVGRATTI